MDSQKKKSLLKETLFVEWVYFCMYWGAFSIIWHFALYVETDYPGRSVIYESNLLMPVASVCMYFMGAYVVFADSGRKRIPIISWIVDLFVKLKNTSKH